MVRIKLPGSCVVLVYHAVPRVQRERFAAQMDDVIQYAKPIPADFQGGLEDGVHHAAVTFDDGFRSVVENALPELRERNIPATLFIPTGHLGLDASWVIDPENSLRKEIVVTAEELARLPSELVTIGSHTIQHSKLPTLTEEEAKQELSQSRQELEKILDREINLLAFPHGEYNEKLVKWAREAGYERVFTILPVMAFSEPGEFVTGRVGVEPTDWKIEFRLKLLGAYRWLPYAFALKRWLLRRGMNQSAD